MLCQDLMWCDLMWPCSWFLKAHQKSVSYVPLQDSSSPWSCAPPRMPWSQFFQLNRSGLWCFGLQDQCAFDKRLSEGASQCHGGAGLAKGRLASACYHFRFLVGFFHIWLQIAAMGPFFVPIATFPRCLEILGPFQEIKICFRWFWSNWSKPS